MNLPAGSAYVEYNDSDSATKAEKYMNGGRLTHKIAMSLMCWVGLSGVYWLGVLAVKLYTDLPCIQVSEAEGQKLL